MTYCYIDRGWPISVSLNMDGKYVLRTPHMLPDEAFERPHYVGVRCASVEEL